jgi:DNA-binding CsgD family transcriptional regulator
MGKQIAEERTGKQVKHLFASGTYKAEIARQLGITRQAVDYHLSDKVKRRRQYIGAKEKARLQALARGRYHLRKATESGVLE